MTTVDARTLCDAFLNAPKALREFEWPASAFNFLLTELLTACRDLNLDTA